VLFVVLVVGPTIVEEKRDREELCGWLWHLPIGTNLHLVIVYKPALTGKGTTPILTGKRKA
jgi:hypothetical protein